MKRSRRIHRNTLSMAIALAATGTGYSNVGSAMQFHRHGNQLIVTGETEQDDPDILISWLDRAVAISNPITTVVFRNGPGGFAEAGLGLGRIIRERNLNTIFDGGCYSACAASFLGGVQRSMTQFDLPHYFGTETILGIHGTSTGGQVDPPHEQDEYLDYLRGMLGQEGEHAMPRIIQSHYELGNSGGFLRYYDPAKNLQPARFCPTEDETSSGGCIDHPRDATIRTDTLVNQAGYATVNDILNVKNRVAGNINPHYGDDSLHDAWGVIRLRPGSHWLLDETSSADVIWVNGGTLQLDRNGNLGSSHALVADREGIVALRSAILDTQVRVADGAILEGYGTVTRPMQFAKNGLFAPQGIVIRSYALKSVEGVTMPFTTGASVLLEEGAAALFTVSADNRLPGLTLEQRDVAAIVEGEDQREIQAKTSRSALLIHPSATLGLDIHPGYYVAGGESLLVDTVIDRTPLTGFVAGVCSEPDAACTLDPVAPAANPFILGSFRQALNKDEADKVVDLTEPGAVVQARKNSLLSFMVQQSEDKIALIANPAFDDTSIFANRHSGDSLGAALRAASHRSATSLAPLLGALQFADKNIVKAQSGALRGDGYATLRSADVNLVREFGGVVDQHLQNVRRGQDEQSAAFAGSLLPASPAANRNTIAGNMSHMLRRLAGAPDDKPAQADGPDGWRFWGRGFGTTGRIDAQEGVAGMRQNSSGLLLGMERRFADGKILLGGSLGFGSMSAKASDKQFRADVDAVDASVYIDARYGAGYVNGTLRYTRLDHEATRSIGGIAGLGAMHKASYRNHAWSVRLEHGLQWSDKHGTVWQPLLPVLDYVRLADQRFAETGGPAALQGRGGSHESLRGGVGLRVWRSFQSSRSGVLTPHAQLLFAHEFKDRDGRLQASFAQEPTLPFKVIGQDTGRNTVAWNLGVGSQMNARTSLALDYVGERSSGRTQHGLMLGLAHKF